MSRRLAVRVERGVTRPLRGVAGVRVGGSFALGVLGLLHSNLVVWIVADHLSYVKRR